MKKSVTESSLRGTEPVPYRSLKYRALDVGLIFVIDPDHFQKLQCVCRRGDSLVYAIVERHSSFWRNRLAEMQLRVLWEEIMNRFHTVELVGDVTRLPNNFIRGIKDVPVRLHRH